MPNINNIRNRSSSGSRSRTGQSLDANGQPFKSPKKQTLDENVTFELVERPVKKRNVRTNDDASRRTSISMEVEHNA